MGLLDHSTNNIIIDAVLTDTGRAFLARNDCSFNIVKFALADDECDYGIIKRFGRVVGSEKIEKNTPIFEACTAPDLSLKWKLASYGSRTLTHLAQLKWVTGPNSSGVIEIARTNIGNVKTQAAVSWTQYSPAGKTNAVDGGDFMWKILIKDGSFVGLKGLTPTQVFTDGSHEYMVPASSLIGDGGFTAGAVTVYAKSVDNTTFSLYKVSGQSYVRTKITINGNNTGEMLTSDITISATTL